jgi:ABC-type lipoprotein release transport system permease subunit
MLDEAAQSLFEAQKSMSSITVTAAGGVMGAITLIVLLFIVNRFIYENQSNMGVLKAMGYPAFKIAVSFLKFGLVVLFGCLIGYAAGMAFSPVVYGVFNDGALPDVIFTFHFEVLIYLIILIRL